MFSAAAATMVSGAFATPLVYDYKASATHMYAKLVNVQNKTTAQRVTVYQKYKKTASLKGYLIVDTDGATSPAINLKKGDAAAVRSQAPVYDQGRNRAFLVVQNSSAEANVRRPKILPAVIDAKWFDTKFTHTAAGATTLSAGIAEGTLYVGGQLINAAYTDAAKDNTLATGYTAITPIRKKLDNGVILPGENTAAGYVTPEMYSDYLWTSCYLFGQYNGPQWSGLFQASERAINARQPVFFRLPAAHNFGQSSAVYHDTWMNHAGIGNSELTTPGTDEVCCGLSIAGAGSQIILKSLAGQMKGGIYLCTENGFEQGNGIYRAFLTTYWEDQFLSPNSTANLQFNDGVGFNADVWVDGDVEQNTTDVVFGSWSINRTTALAPVGLTWEEKNNLLQATYNSNRGANTAASCWTRTGAAGTQAAPAVCSRADLDVLNQYIKGAAVRLNSGVTFCTGAEIYDLTVATRFNIPFLTTQFARAYGLAGYGL